MTVDTMQKARAAMASHNAASISASKALNIFRLAADLVHLASIVILGMKMSKTRSCSGISLKSQLLYLLVYVTRYLDLFKIDWKGFLSVYNFLMKLFFIGSQIVIVHAMMRRFRATHNPKLDTFRMEAVIVPCLVLALFMQSRRQGIFDSFREYSWTFSVLLEAVAILPQMFLLQKTGEAETITTHYLLCLGSYRALYLVNWVYRYLFSRPPEGVVVFAGIVQTVLYSDFFYIYYKRVFTGRAFKLPI